MGVAGQVRVFIGGNEVAGRLAQVATGLQQLHQVEVYVKTYNYRTHLEEGKRHEDKFEVFLLFLPPTMRASYLRV